MNEQLLTNICDIFSADGLTENDYEAWKSNFSKSEEFQKNELKVFAPQPSEFFDNLLYQLMTLLYDRNAQQVLRYVLLE